MKELEALIETLATELMRQAPEEAEPLMRACMSSAADRLLDLLDVLVGGPPAVDGIDAGLACLLGLTLRVATTDDADPIQ